MLAVDERLVAKLQRGGDLRHRAGAGNNLAARRGGIDGRATAGAQHMPGHAGAERDRRAALRAVEVGELAGDAASGFLDLGVGAQELALERFECGGLAQVERGRGAVGVVERDEGVFAAAIGHTRVPTLAHTEGQFTLATGAVRLAHIGQRELLAVSIVELARAQRFERHGVVRHATREGHGDLA